MSAPDNFAVRIAFEIGLDTPGLLAEWSDVADRLASIRARMKPLKAEIEMLASRFEGRGQQPSHWDHERTAKLGEIIESERGVRQRASEKVVESALESFGRASPAYQRFLEHGRQERDRLARLRGQTDELWAELEVLNARREYLKGAVDHANALLYAYRAEARATGLEGATRAGPPQDHRRNSRGAPQPVSASVRDDDLGF